MKKLSILFALIIVGFAASAQILKPVTWAYKAKRISKTEAVVQIRATIDQGWHIYSQHLAPGGPNPTVFAFSPSKDFTLNGKTTEPKPVTYFDKNYKMNIGYFENQVVFQQKIKLNKAATAVKGKVTFMVCDDTQCLPAEDVNFNIPVK
ncbi:protein-disulfide reductase DsbD N-terminal domain-containing protein [Pedobacter frigoris]|uniref:protein-disulfide reductase DsbD N-terminal domain-containing protein n=1 Tax=Pedobacter frigoris TaxID=2571272 RepID=UPI00292E8ED4|nr:protein-disulfide reductase DsbD N-terminal domain-containing protein [Pedobacter frigoris]